jgi:hypothetical protein
MKSFEILSTILLVFGAITIVITIFPVINPRQFEIMGGISSPERYFLGLGFGVILLASAYYLNRRAHK